jgi:hypothetical protein
MNYAAEMGSDAMIYLSSTTTSTQVGEKSTYHNEIQNVTIIKIKTTFYVFQAKTQNRSTQNANEGNTQSKEDYTQILEKIRGTHYITYSAEIYEIRHGHVLCNRKKHSFQFGTLV